MKNNEKTIVAISTPIGSGGISIVRLSGANSFFIAKKMITKLSGESDNFIPRQMYLCKIKTENFSDIGLVVFFKNPNSFTGEDMVEFQVHGGVFLANGVVKQCLNLGATLAEPGEFSRLAFLNGKSSLDELEGVINLINSESEAQVNAAFALASGQFYKTVKSLQNKITNTLAEINVSLDYPDEDLEVDTVKSIKEKLVDYEKSINEILDTFEKGKIIKHGINCAIVGLPNAGKSSLLNALLNEDRAIVSSIAGTTRDVIKESFLINGLKVNLVDTAGINDAKDEIEKIGVERAIKEANDADLVLYLFDASKKFSKEDEEILERIKNKNIILVRNKKDISINEKNSLFNKFRTVEISASKKENINKLKEEISNSFETTNLKNSAIILTEERHFNALKKAVKNINEAISLCEDSKSLDIISSLISGAYNSLGEITGEVGSEKIIDEIFSKFCLGK